jgi:hypothetical protein
MAKVQAKTLADFRAAHDKNVIIPNKIRDALAKMAKIHPEQYEYEAEFIKLAGISQTDLGNFRTKFEKHIVVTSAVGGRSGKRVWFATEKAAKAARGE